MTMTVPDQRETKAAPAKTATDFQPDRIDMGKLRTQNKRHKRALSQAVEARRRAAVAVVEAPVPAKGDL
ncbi:MAG TPA: hypothetical protein VF463_14725 [Sphingobium sp.]